MRIALGRARDRCRPFRVVGRATANLDMCGYPPGDLLQLLDMCRVSADACEAHGV